MSAGRLLCFATAIVLLAGGCEKKRGQSAESALRWAACNGDMQEVQSLIVRGVSVHATDYDGHTPLHCAAEGGHVEVARLLIRCGARIDPSDKQGRTPAVLAMTKNHRAVVEYLLREGAAANLHLAAYLGDVTKARSLIDGGADVNGKDPDGWTALHHAASQNQREVAKLLIVAGADLSTVTDSKGYRRSYIVGTALHHAVEGGYRGLVGLLIDSGADIDARAKQGETPLYLAVKVGRVGMVKLLLARRADANLSVDDDSFCGGIPLGVAVDEGRPDLVEALLAGGADVNIKDGSGWTPLHVAITSKYWSAVDAAMHIEHPDVGALQTDRDRYFALRNEIHAALVARMVRLLVAHGANVSTKDEEGITPLHCAAYKGQKDVVELLIAAGADVNARTVPDPARDDDMWENLDIGYRLRCGVTPLHEAVVSGEPSVVELLIAHGAEVNTADQSGGTPLHYAALRGPNVVELLVAHGAEVNAVTASGHTPLHYAARGAKPHILQLLIARGANVNAADAEGATPLVAALLRGHVEAARVLIAAGAERVAMKNHPPTVYWSGVAVREPILHSAVRYHVEARRPRDPDGRAEPNEREHRRQWAELLIAHGAEVDGRDEHGNTPLHAAVLRGDGELARLFITHGADVNARNELGITPTQYAASAPDANLVSLLLESGADANVRDNDGDTPLHAATRRGHKEVVELLLSHGADVTLRNTRDRTPLDEAIRRGDADIAGLLTAASEGRSRVLPGDRS